MAYARAILINRGKGLDAATQVEQSGGSDRVVRALKAVSTPGTIADADWAKPLSPVSTIAAGFLQSLAGSGLFDAMLSATVRLPLQHLHIVSVMSVATGASVDEAMPKPISQLRLAADEMPVKKAAAIFVISQELARAESAQAFLTNELKKACAVAADGVFIDLVSEGVTPSIATADPAADIAAAAASLTLGAGSRLYLGLPPSVAVALSLKTGTDGAFLYPNLGPSGGSIGGIIAVATDALTDSAVLIDAAQVATAGNGIEVDSVSHASVEMSDTPTGAATISLWQHNLLGIKAERFFAARAIGAGVAVIDGVSAWSV